MDPKAYEEIAKVESHHWWFVARRQIFSSIIRSMNLQDRAQIMEVGAGTGGNLQMLMQFGDVYATEMDERARQLALDQIESAVPVKFGKCPEAIPFEEKRFHLICMFDVLEHIEEDIETLDMLRHRLVQGGRILITVPAYQWMWSGHDEFLHHKRRYSSSKLRKILLSSGYSIERISYFNTLLFPIAALVRIKDKITGRQPLQVNKVPFGIINSSFRSIFAAESNLIKYLNMPFGLSIFAVASQLGEN